MGRLVRAREAHTCSYDGRTDGRRGQGGTETNTVPTLSAGSPLPRPRAAGRQLWLQIPDTGTPLSGKLWGSSASTRPSPRTGLGLWPRPWEFSRPPKFFISGFLLAAET